MEILDNKKDDIIKYLKLSVQNPLIEFEYIYGQNIYNNLSKDKFLRLIEYCNSYYIPKGIITNLDIKCELQPNIRTTINNLNDIKTYCKTDELHDIMDVSYIKKEDYKDESKKIMSIKDNEYNYRINLKTEDNLNKDSPEIIVLLKEWKDEKKYFRYKRRTSFVTKDNQFQIDITAVKSSSL